MAKKPKSTPSLSNVAEAIVQTTEKSLGAQLPSKWAGLLPTKPRGPAIAERKPTEPEAQRLAVFKDGVLMRTLAYALSMKRPHEGVGERNLLGYILLNRPGDSRWTFDTAGNLHIDMCSEKTHRTLFVAHVDTVHHKDGYNKIRMTESVWYAHGSQLGADDGAGVAMLMHLMTEGVPGHYVFTLGEECGGIGSSALVKAMPQMFKRFDRAIAFDRRGTTSVISHQSMGRCCSDEFAEALSAALTTDELMYMPDDTGVYTDTAEFVDLVSECTNISVGYEREHSDEEAQDILHLQALAEQCVRLAWDELPVVRDPNEPDDLYGGRWGSPTPYKRRDYDFKLFLSADELDAYNTVVDAADGHRVRPLAVHVAAAIADWYPECTPEMLLNRATTACEGLGMMALLDYAAEIEGGADVQEILQSIYEYGQPI
jgi:hypothetical protein